jgi:hypothetical protein
MWLQPGDVQLLQNHNIVHNRSEFEDHEVGNGQRVLLATFGFLRTAATKSRACP